MNESLLVALVALLALVFFMFKARSGFKKYRAALNALVAKYTFDNLDNDTKSKVIDRTLDIVPNIDSDFNRDSLSELRDYERYGFIALAMAELDIPPAVHSFDWQYVKNPFTALIDAGKEIQLAQRQIWKSDGITVDFEEPDSSVGSEERTTQSHFEFTPSMPDFSKGTIIKDRKIGGTGLLFYKDAPSLSENISGNLPHLHFHYMMIAFRENSSEPFLLVTLESIIGQTENNLCAFDNKGIHHNFGKRDDLTDQDRFESEAIKVLAQFFKNELEIAKESAKIAQDKHETSIRRHKLYEATIRDKNKPKS